MIAAIERFVFNYLYKYDSVSIDIERIIDISEEDLRNHLTNPNDTIEKEFDRILPVFEQDHEVILVELDRNLVKIPGKVIITFKSILAVYPLTELGRQLLSGKLNEDFKISPPKFAQVIEKIKIERSLKNRQNAAKRIFSVFEIKEFPNQDFVQEVKQVITSFLRKDNSIKKSFLYHLITYNKTPSFLPPGNAEFLSKVGLLAMNLIGREEEVFKNGPLYKACVFYKDKLNTSTPSDGLNKYYELPDEDLKNSHNIMIKIISENHTELNIFKIAYFFLAMKSYLLKNDNNLALIYNNIIEELKQDKTTALHVLYLIGYTFSFEQLYEGLHTLDRAPLLERKFLKPKSVATPHDNKITIDYVAETSIRKEEIKEITSGKELVDLNEKNTMEPEMEGIKLENEGKIENVQNDGIEDKTIVVADAEVNDSDNSVNQIIQDGEGKKFSSDEELEENNLKSKTESNHEELKLQNASNNKIIQNDTVEEKSTIVSNAVQIAEGDVTKKVLELKQWVIRAAIGDTKKTNWKKLFESTFSDEDFVTFEQFADAIAKDPDPKKKLFTSKTKKSIHSFEPIDIINYFKNIG